MECYFHFIIFARKFSLKWVDLCKYLAVIRCWNNKIIHVTCKQNKTPYQQTCKLYISSLCILTLDRYEIDLSIWVCPATYGHCYQHVNLSLPYTIFRNDKLINIRIMNIKVNYTYIELVVQKMYCRPAKLSPKIFIPVSFTYYSAESFLDRIHYSIL